MRCTEFYPTIEICQKAFDLLQLKGYFNDEMCLGSVVIEHHDRELINFLKEKMGYQGDLVSRGYFYPQHGAVYYIFDINKLSEEEAKRITDEWVENHKF
ncbi:hypothetical protein CGC56_07095 [Capnocytophaga canimorsus]|uniref:Uncharacterized protein n=1 Tax=Capnocytophaga canimorsus TaxID=28188 RepID=A0A250G3E8_9FLAO|nr:hypothetical protein [Capnocytophaga canimorsus]ATA91949.1 hypothetical protein CGC56_07095 [Capnocytophaga canimorsus]